MKPIKKILVGGCFDLIHFGHISFLKQAKALGTYLVVALESDKNVRLSKGDSRPVHTQEQRKEMLESLIFVDKVIALPFMESDKQYFDLVDSIRPHVIAITQGDPVTEKKQLQADKIHATLSIIPKIYTPSTSQIAKLLGLE